MTDKLTPGQLRDLASALVASDDRKHALTECEKMLYRISHTLEKEAAHREAEAEAAFANVPPDMRLTQDDVERLLDGDAPPPPAPQAGDELAKVPKEIDIRTFTLNGIRYVLGTVHDQTVEALRARAEAAEAREKEISENREWFERECKRHINARVALEADAKRLREAGERLVAAVEDVGVQHFDTDTLPPEVEKMRDATAVMRTALAQGGNDG